MTSQPHSVQVTVYAGLECKDCYIVADLTNHIYTGNTNGKTGSSQHAPTPTTYVIIRAYSITSAYFLNGVCTTVSGSAITLPTPYSLLKPATPYDVESFRSNGNLMLQSYAGFTGCSAGGTGVMHTEYLYTTDTTGAPPTTSIVRTGLAASTTSVSLITSIVSTNSTSQLRQSASAVSTRASSIGLGSDLPRLTTLSLGGLPAEVKIVIGVVIPLVVVALLCFLRSVFLRYKHCARGRKASRYEDTDGKKDSLPYFQQKPELHGDQCRHELPAEHKWLEVQAEEMRHQLHADERRLELEACHCPHELEAPVSP
ncbi:hypothetical protein MMC29_004658 [Sticta canariensis]|nr:hypothetical protein [Sticta canariensis]